MMSNQFSDPAALRYDPQELEDAQQFVLEINDAKIRQALIERFGLSDLKHLRVEGALELRHGMPFARANLTAEVEMVCSVSLEPFVLTIEDDLETYFVPEAELPQLQDDENLNEPLSEDGQADVGEFLMQSFSLMLPDIPRKPGLEPLVQSFGPAWEPEEKPNPFAALAGIKTKEGGQ